MSARIKKTTRKAFALIDFGYTPTFRQLMVSYKFWTNIIRRKRRYDLRTKGISYV